MEPITRIEKFDHRIKNPDGTFSYPPEHEQEICVGCYQPMTRGSVLSNGEMAGVECSRIMEQASIEICSGVEPIAWITEYENKKQRGINKGLYDWIFKTYVIGRF